MNQLIKEAISGLVLGFGFACGSYCSTGNLTNSLCFGGIGFAGGFFSHKLFT